MVPKINCTLNIVSQSVVQAFARGILIIALLLALMTKTGFAATGTITYAAGNCFVIETEKGFTLFERSGGASPEVGVRVTGILHDYGYQQIYDQAGNELLVGYVQYWGVGKGAELDSFKQECR